MKKSRIRSVSPKKGLERKADRLWSQAIKARDKGRCQKCGKPGTDPHHIFTRSIKHLRHDLRNGVTLCKGCHVFGPTSAHKGPEAFRDWLLSWMGEREFTKLKLSANTPSKPDYQMAILELEAYLKNLS